MSRPKQMLNKSRGVDVDPKNQTVIVTDKELNAVLTYHAPELFRKPLRTPLWSLAGRLHQSPSRLSGTGRVAQHQVSFRKPASMLTVFAAKRFGWSQFLQHC
jgi:hypothetical protein